MSANGGTTKTTSTTGRTPSAGWSEASEAAAATGAAARVARTAIALVAEDRQDDRADRADDRRDRVDGRDLADVRAHGLLRRRGAAAAPGHRRGDFVVGGHLVFRGVELGVIVFDRRNAHLQRFAFVVGIGHDQTPRRYYSPSLSRRTPYVPPHRSSSLPTRPHARKCDGPAAVYPANCAAWRFA